MFVAQMLNAFQVEFSVRSHLIMKKLFGRLETPKWGRGNDANRVKEEVEEEDDDEEEFVTENIKWKSTKHDTIT